MKTSASKSLPVRLALLSGIAIAAFAVPAQAQDGRYMRNMLTNFGLLPEEKDQIEYRERPTLVVPKETGKLRAPVDSKAKTANSQWPVDPDVQEREREKARKQMPAIFATASNPSEGGRMKVDDLAAGRAAKGAKMGEDAIPRNDKDGVVASIQEMTEIKRDQPSYPPGTEPPRRYLTDPPTGLRIPSSQAAAGKRTYDGPVVDSFKEDVWKRSNND